MKVIYILFLPQLAKWILKWVLVQLVVWVIGSKINFTCIFYRNYYNISSDILKVFLLGIKLKFNRKLFTDSLKDFHRISIRWLQIIPLKFINDYTRNSFIVFIQCIPKINSRFSKALFKIVFIIFLEIYSRYFLKHYPW